MIRLLRRFVAHRDLPTPNGADERRIVIRRQAAIRVRLQAARLELDRYGRR